MQKKHILIFTLAWSPVESGGEIAPRKTAEMLSDDYEFDVIGYRFEPEHAHEEKTSYGTVHRLGGFGHAHARKNFWILLAAHLAIKLHKKNNYDAVWVVMAAYGAGAAFWFNLFYPKVPILLTLQEGDPFEHIYQRLGILRPLWHRFFKRVTAVQAISNHLAEFAKTCGFQGIPEVVPNGVDVPKELGARSSELVKKEKIVLISNSRLERKNGFDIVIKALKLLPENIIFKNVGDGTERENLAKLVCDLELESRVTLDSAKPYEQGIEYLKQGDIFVRPSRTEGLGSSFLEAMSLGLPIIGTPVGGIPDFLKDGETGIFCEPESSESFAKAVMKLVENPELYERVRKGGYELMKEKFSWQSVGVRMRKIIDSLC